MKPADFGSYLQKEVPKGGVIFKGDVSPFSGLL